ncbi:hypothetical protein SLEP1_g53111 [Rubroshorea leprosula]|uniref:Uncharacterized protein n=1 Tax=Rubroshorea leprosula TaxID=152421 RepID=A0AAV5M8K4_9ROSI|nr:hypothetical protein SLEP1_g53111 [Rubroshorea leprosula]
MLPLRMLNLRLGLVLSLSMLFLLSIRSQAAVSSIGLGSDWLKVAVVNLKPGQSPISIVINEMSKCKSPALVAFQSGTQLLGEEAAGIVARYPDKLYSQLRDMVGKPYKHVKGFIDSMFLPFDILEDSRAAAEGKWLLQAAQLAGINVLSLINGHSGQFETSIFLNTSISCDISLDAICTVLIVVKDIRWDSELGGQNMELRLVEYFADEFNKQLGNGVDVRKSPKAMAKLKKQAKRTKEILSANTMAPISIESFYDDRDFRSTITHEKFEELHEDLQEKSLTPVKEVLKYSGLEVDDIYAVEFNGGATRIPKLQVKLQDFLEEKSWTNTWMLRKQLFLAQPSMLLVPRMKKLPSKMFRTIVHNKDFGVSLGYESEDLLPLDLLSPVFAQYVVSGLAEVSEKYSSHNLSAPIKTNLHFSLSRSGMNATIASSNISAEVGAEKAPEENKEGLNSDSVVSRASNTNTNTDTTVEEPSTVDLGTKKRLKKKTFRVPLKIVEKTAGPGMSLLKESLAKAKEKLDCEEFEKISSVDEHQSFMEELDEVQEWLYTDGEEATAKEFQERLDSLTAISDLIVFLYDLLSGDIGFIKLSWI